STTEAAGRTATGFSVMAVCVSRGGQSCAEGADPLRRAPQPRSGTDVLPRTPSPAGPPAPRQPADVHHRLGREVLLARAALARGGHLAAVLELDDVPRVHRGGELRPGLPGLLR